MTTPAEYREMAASISTHWTGGPILTIQGAMKCASMLREAADMRDALERIAKLDYRGNRSQEMQIAYHALGGDR